MTEAVKKKKSTGMYNTVLTVFLGVFFFGNGGCRSFFKNNKTVFSLHQSNLVQNNFNAVGYMQVGQYDVHPSYKQFRIH
jgi:hypothetical protein